jgi:hypothetical protein
VPGSSYDDKVRVYALADPARIFEVRDAVKAAVLEALQVPPANKYVVTISQSSGWLDYAVDGELWVRKAPPALRTQSDAVKAAESTLAHLEAKCSGANPRWPLTSIPLLPPVSLLNRIGAAAVPRPDGSAWDHWLYRAEPRLQLDGGARTMAGVYGAQIEVRIGHLGQVIGVRSRWRPITGERKFTDLLPYRPPAPNRVDPNEERQPPILNYLLEGNGTPQYYLAPYYFSSNGDDIQMSGATSWSLTVSFGRTAQDESHMTITALAQGGSGNYRYNWAVYSLPDVDDGFQELGAGQEDMVKSLEGQAITSSIQLPNGHYTVMVNVKDRKTGAFKHFQQQVFSSPFLSSTQLVA